MQMPVGGSCGNASGCTQRGNSKTGPLVNSLLKSKVKSRREALEETMFEINIRISWKKRRFTR